VWETCQTKVDIQNASKKTKLIAVDAAFAELIQGCQILLGTKMGKNVPNDHIIYQRAMKYSK
jgi:hypothetical protein